MANIDLKEKKQELEASFSRGASSVGSFFKKLFIGITLIGIVGSILVLLAINYMNISEGKRAGRIMKISKKGMLLKTYEGQLQVGSIEDGVPTVWYFSVDENPEALRKIDEALDKDKKVKLYYNEKYIKLPWNGDTKYMVTKVELLP